MEAEKRNVNRKANVEKNMKGHGAINEKMVNTTADSCVCKEMIRRKTDE